MLILMQNYEIFSKLLFCRNYYQNKKKEQQKMPKRLKHEATNYCDISTYVMTIKKKSTWRSRRILSQHLKSCRDIHPKGMSCINVMKKS